LTGAAHLRRAANALDAVAAIAFRARRALLTEALLAASACHADVAGRAVRIGPAGGGAGRAVAGVRAARQRHRRTAEPGSVAGAGQRGGGHAERAAGTEALQRYGKQEVAAGVMQVPAPSQADWRTRVVVPDAQVAGAHGVPNAYFWQTPASHLPFVPQVAGSRSMQVCDGSGAPVGTAVQMPIDPASAHERHAPMQSVAQHTPWAQLPDRHWGPFEQNAPFGFLPH